MYAQSSTSSRHMPDFTQYSFDEIMAAHTMHDPGEDMDQSSDQKLPMDPPPPRTPKNKPDTIDTHGYLEMKQDKELSDMFHKLNNNMQIFSANAQDIQALRSNHSNSEDAPLENDIEQRAGQWTARAVVTGDRFISREREKYRNNRFLQDKIRQRFKDIWKDMLMKADDGDRRAQHVDDEPHDCTERGCQWKIAEIQLFSYYSEGKVSRHLCGGPDVCAILHDQYLHNPRERIWTCRNIAVCFSTGVLHDCVSGCNLACENKVSGMEIVCPLTGISGVAMYNDFEGGSSNHEDSKYEVSRSLFQEMCYENARTNIKIAKLRGEEPLVFKSQDQESVTLLDRDMFVNSAEHQFYLLRYKLANFFSKQRVMEEVLKNIQFELSLCKGVDCYLSNAAASQNPVCMKDLERITSAVPYHGSAFVAFSQHTSQEEVRRFITFFGFLCFCIWRYICEKWNLVLQTSNNDVEEVLEHEDESIVAREIDDSNTQGKIKLAPCAMALMRIMMKKDFLPHHDILNVVIPLNSLDDFGFVARAATAAQNMIRTFFTKVKREHGLSPDSLIMMPHFSWREVCALDLDLDAVKQEYAKPSFNRPDVKIDYTSVALRNYLATHLHNVRM